MTPLFHYRHLVFALLMDSERLRLAAAKITLATSSEKYGPMHLIEGMEEAHMVYYVDISRDPFLPQERWMQPDPAIGVNDLINALTVWANGLMALYGHAYHVTKVEFTANSPYQFGTSG